MKETNKAKERMEVIYDKDGRQLTEEVLGRWHESFEELLNVSEERKAQLMAVGRDGMNSTRNSKQILISKKELADAVTKLKYGKAKRFDDVAIEMIKKSG